MNKSNAKRLTQEEVKQGYFVCGCGNFAHIFYASVLSKLPKDYSGELCQECSCWMVSVEKLIPNVE